MIFVIRAFELFVTGGINGNSELS